jgi:hypothetical protein
VPLSVSKLRDNLYDILDAVLNTGTPAEVMRRGRLLRIVPAQTPSKLSRLKKREYALRDPESIVHLEWFRE